MGKQETNNYDDNEIDIEQQVKPKNSAFHVETIPVPTFAEGSLPFCPLDS